jgi:hypothetical protein
MAERSSERPRCETFPQSRLSSRLSPPRRRLPSRGIPHKRKDRLKLPSHKAWPRSKVNCVLAATRACSSADSSLTKARRRAATCVTLPLSASPTSPCDARMPTTAARPRSPARMIQVIRPTAPSPSGFSEFRCVRQDTPVGTSMIIAYAQIVRKSTQTEHSAGLPSGGATGERRRGRGTSIQRRSTTSGESPASCRDP